MNKINLSRDNQNETSFRPELTPQNLELLRRFGAEDWNPNTRAEILRSTFAGFLSHSFSDLGEFSSPVIKNGTELSFEI